MLEYAAALKQRQLQMPLLTTGITSVASPHTEEILRAAKQLGVQYTAWALPTGKPTRRPGSRSAKSGPSSKTWLR